MTLCGLSTGSQPDQFNQLSGAWAIVTTAHAQWILHTCYLSINFANRKVYFLYGINNIWKIMFDINMYNLFDLPNKVTYCNWRTGMVFNNGTENYKLSHNHNSAGLAKFDWKVVAQYSNLVTQHGKAWKGNIWRVNNKSTTVTFICM